MLLLRDKSGSRNNLQVVKKISSPAS